MHGYESRKCGWSIDTEKKVVKAVHISSPVGHGVGARVGSVVSLEIDTH